MRLFSITPKTSFYDLPKSSEFGPNFHCTPFGISLRELLGILHRPIYQESLYCIYASSDIHDHGKFQLEQIRWGEATCAFMLITDEGATCKQRSTPGLGRETPNHFLLEQYVCPYR